ncbi:MAG: hypothetical protein EAX96_13815 [Candidatus Lokiarchaeota archaeon]|nr:hypothetical protein [Candidatus Lokiarchaeota archaeon]
MLIMIFGLIGFVIILKSKFKEKINIIYATIAIFVPEIMLILLALFTGDILILSEPNIALTEAMKISNNVLIMLIVFLVGALIVYFSDFDNINIIYCALPLFTVITNLFSIYRVVYFFYPFTNDSNVQYFLLYLEQQLLKGTPWYTFPFELIFWSIDLGILLFAIIYAIRTFAHSEILEKQKILEMDLRKKDPYKYPNINPGEFEEIYFDDEEKEQNDS